MELINKKAHEFLHDLETKRNLQLLQRKIGGLNVFSILKSERNEIRHSNILAWLIDPYGNHGLGTQFAEVFFVNIANKTNGNEIFISKLMLNGLDDLTVFREKDNIDILMVSNDSKQVIVIENKTGSELHSNQLDKYENSINEQYPSPDYDKLFLYLDSNMSFNKDIGEWNSIDYSVVESSVEFFLNGELNTKLDLILTDYLAIIRRYLMNKIDTETQQLCDEIYAKYREVFDFIIANKSNQRGKFFEIVSDYLIKNAEEFGIIVNPIWSTNAYLRFAVKDMQVISDKNKWVDGQHILLELYCTQDLSYNALSIVTYAGDNSDNEIIKKIWSSFPKTNTKETSQWRNFGGQGIKWHGDLSNDNDVQKALKKIRGILLGNKMQELFSKIKSIIND